MISIIVRRWQASQALLAELFARDPEARRLIRLYRRYVKVGGRYLYVHTGLALALPGARRRMFLRSLRRDARRISARDLEELLGLGWRERGTAFWLIAAGRRTDLRAALARLPGDLSAMNGYGLALACLGGEEDARLLEAYLRTPPGPDDDGADRPEALAALLHLDALLGTDRAGPFLTPDILGGRNPAELRHHFEQQLVFMSGGRPDLGVRLHPPFL